MLMRWLSLLVVLAFAVAAACGDTDEGFGEISESTWDVLILGDSYLADVGEPYAEHVAQANSVEVVLHNEWTNNLSAKRLLSWLQAEDSALTQLQSEDHVLAEWTQDQVRMAEVVVYFANPAGLIPEDQEENCWNGGRTIAESHCDGSWEALQEAWGQIAVEIKRLRDGRPTIIRTLDGYSPGVGRWEQAGVYDDCLACDTYSRDAKRAAAAAESVLIAKTSDAFNGPDITEDPRKMGYIPASDYHPSPEGAQVMADALHELGYEPTP